ncbi:unnamed protein product [Rhizophagus irregularis]|nr:unnamed protein product [Rhizophagus irregularis]CAB5357198.1 unnamed protein product [Rhizophagus irregularis]
MRLRLFILTTLFLTLSLAWLAQSAPAAIKFPSAAIEETGQFLLEDNRPPISAHFSNSPLDECRYCVHVIAIVVTRDDTDNPIYKV